MRSSAYTGTSRIGSLRWRVVKLGVLISAAIGAVVVAPRLDAQEFWVVPDAYAHPSASTIIAIGHVGSRFSRVETPLRSATVADARLVDSAGNVRITNLSPDGATLRFKQRPPRPGQYVVAVALKPRTARTTQAMFFRWLRAERADSEVARLARETAFAPTDTVTYRSQRYATAVVEFKQGPRAYRKGAGYPIDIIPLSDPARTTAGDTLSFRLMIDGDPISGLLVRVSQPRARNTRPAAATRSGTTDSTYVTDHSGVVRVPVMRVGVWGLSTARVVLLASPEPSGPEPGFWDVTWVTYVFKVSPRPIPDQPFSVQHQNHHHY